MLHINHLNRRRPIVNLDADWTPYTDALPQNSVALGTITLGPATGALVQIGDEYLMIHARGIHKLNTRKVGIAIQKTVSEADKATGNGSGDSSRD